MLKDENPAWCLHLYLEVKCQDIWNLLLNGSEKMCVQLEHEPEEMKANVTKC